MCERDREKDIELCQKDHNGLQDLATVITNYVYLSTAFKSFKHCPRLGINHNKWT